MKIQKIMLVALFSIASLVLLCSIDLKMKNIYKFSQKINFGHENEISKPPSLLMYENLEKYSKEYNIPKYIIYNIAFLETRYEGPFDWDYNPSRTSSAGAVGAMQIMPATANYICDKNVSITKLKTDIRFNIGISVKLLQKLYKKYHNWGLVCGCYNTGRPIINDYAVFCKTNKDYQQNWEYIKN